MKEASTLNIRITRNGVEKVRLTLCHVPPKRRQYRPTCITTLRSDRASLV
jgi:hypothetical protein